LPAATVSFNPQGGTFIEAQTSNASGKIAYPGPSVRPGHLFAGWYESPDCSGLPVLFPYSVSSDKTLYAKWIAESDFMNSSKRPDYYSHAMQYSVFRSDARMVDIAMLGAHDAFTHNITKSSEIDPGDDNATALKLLNAFGGGQTIANGAKAQNEDAYTQARHGCRLFDTRICWYGDTWYTMHAKLSDRLDRYLKEILRFLSENKREVVVIYIWPESAVHLNGSNYTSLWNYIMDVKYDGKNIFDYIHFDPNAKPLQNLTYGDVIGSDGSSGVVLFCLDSSGASHKAYTASSSVRGKWHDTKDIAALLNNIQSEHENIAANWGSYKNRLRIMQAQRTSSTGDNLITMASEFNYRVANDSRFETWLEKTPVVWFDDITTPANNFNQTVNKRIHNYNLGSAPKTLPPGMRVSESVSVGAGVENWYYIAFMKSNGASETAAPPRFVCAAAVNANVVLDQKFAYDGKDALEKLRWKIVPASPGKYWLISQNGCYLDGIQTKTSSCEWTLTQQTGSWSGYWQLNQDGDASNIFAHYDGEINLWTDNNQSKGNDGTALLFLPAPLTSLPGDEHWYYIVSTRVADTYGKAMQDNGSHSAVSAVALNSDNDGQFWQIKNHNLVNFELRSKKGNRMKVAGGDGSNIQTGNGYGDGSNFVMEYVEGGARLAGFNIRCKTEFEDGRHLYISPQETGKYWAKTAPHSDYVLDFIPVVLSDITSATDADSSDDPAVEIQYFNLQGLRLTTIPRNQIVIERTLYQSGKVKVVKKFLTHRQQ
jgi:hypothetical protein